VRSQFEVQCMAYKRKHGYPTERELAGGAASGSYTSPASDAATRRAEIAERRAAVARARAEAARDRWR
jgi:hypothetical protein